MMAGRILAMACFAAAGVDQEIISQQQMVQISKQALGPNRPSVSVYSTMSQLSLDRLGQYSNGSRLPD